MIHFKNRYQSGFTLIEAMIAIAIVGMVITPMLILETNIFSSVMRMGEKFHRLIIGKHFLYSVQEQEPSESIDYHLEKKIDKPLSTIRYTLKSIDKKSSLAKVARLFKQEVVVAGLEKASPESRIIHYIYKPEMNQT